MAFVGLLPQIKLLFGSLVTYKACVVYTKTIIHLSVSESGGYMYLLSCFALSKYPPLFTSTSVNNC